MYNIYIYIYIYTCQLGNDQHTSAIPQLLTDGGVNNIVMPVIL